MDIKTPDPISIYKAKRVILPYWVFEQLSKTQNGFDALVNYKEQRSVLSTSDLIDVFALNKAYSFKGYRGHLSHEYLMDVLSPIGIHESVDVNASPFAFEYSVYDEHEVIQRLQSLFDGTAVDQTSTLAERYPYNKDYEFTMHKNILFFVVGPNFSLMDKEKRHRLESDLLKLFYTVLPLHEVAPFPIFKRYLKTL